MSTHFEKWEIVSHGGTWSIREEKSGDTIADDILYGSVAQYITDLHNTEVDSMIAELYDL